MATDKEKEHAKLVACGGRPMSRTGLMTSIPDEAAGYNFGVTPKTTAVTAKITATPSLHQKYPQMAGAWDGSSTINHVDAVLKNYAGDWTKVEDLIQYQPRGTCGGRSGSAAMDFIQHVLIASGKRAKFHRVSHAAVYYMARRLFSWVGGGNWQNEDDDGVASGSVPDAIAKMGAVQREEDNDGKFYGAGSDDLACQLVCGLHPALEKTIIESGSDNLVTDWVKVTNAQELADGIASGGIGLGSDNQGFTMTRDSRGFCRPTGTWSHYQIRPSVGKFDGTKGFGYWQSWGKTTPGGPKLAGHPGNCFGVEFDVQDRIIKSGDWAVVFGFPLWELDATPVVPWVF